MRAKGVNQERDRLASPRRWAWSAVVAMLLIVPLAFDGVMKDAFRAPKEIAFRGGAILLLVVFSFAWSASRFRVNWTAWRNPVYLLPALILIWTGVTTLTSQNRRLSIDSLFTVVCSVIFVLGARFALKTHRSAIALDLVMVGPVINAILEMLQEYGLWQPFDFPRYLVGHAASTALLGNPNDVGMFLVLPAVACVVAVGTWSGRRRVIWLVITAIVGAGLVTSGTRTAFIAFGAAMLVLIVIASRRIAIVVAVVLLVALIPVAMPTTKPGQDFRKLMHAAKAQEYDILFSERLPGFLTAWDMFRDHPIVGVGPGSYKFLYMPYRLALYERYRPEWTKGLAANFREVHNDHLQILAETGVPGYLLVLATILVLAFPGRRRSAPPDDARARFARTLRLPFVVASVVFALAQFPLQLAAPRMVFLYFATICVTWDD